MLQVYEAGEAAGHSSQLVYAKLDVQRFVDIYSAKGRWALIDDLAASAASPVDQATEAVARSEGRVSIRATTSKAPTISLAAIEKVVRDSAVNILGSEVEGTLKLPPTMHAS